MKLARALSTDLLAVALDTWRLAWRDPLTRVEVLLLLVLTLFSSIATVGSPTAGDGAIQMFAIAYAVTPFALVLLVGQIGRNVRAEVAWWGRPLSRESYYLGRFLGYLSVGVCIVALSAGAGALLMAAIGGFALGPALAWNAWFALATLPGLVTVAGGSLFLLQRTGPGIRYFTPAILISLALAFADYKWSTMAAALPHLDFWNPFPGFLTLGLALPPRLLGMPPVSGWIWLNRLAYVGVGLGLLAAAIAFDGKHGFRYPLRRRAAVRASAAVAAAAVIACGIALHGIASSLSPGLLSARLPTGAAMPPAAAVPDGSPREARAAVAVTLTVDPTSGAVRGRAIYRHLTGLRIYFELNAGLTPVSVRRGGHPLEVRRVGSGRRVLPHSAASLWSVALPEQTAGPLAITYRGFLLPQASTLPYPPFALGRVYDTMIAGNGRLFLNGLGTWLPVVVDRRGHPVSGVRGGSLRLAMAGATTGATTVTNMRTLPAAPGWGGRIGSSVLMAAPYAVTALAFAEDLSAVPPPGASLSAAQLYAAAWRSLEAVLPGPQRSLEIAESPVTEQPELVGNILVASDLHPYQLPIDPVTGSVTSTPTPERCLGELVSLWWSQRIHRTVGLYPRPATRLQSQAGRVMAALDLLYLSPKGERPRLAGDLRRGALPGIGRLDPTERTETGALWRQVRAMSYRGWERLRTAAAEKIADPTATWATVSGLFGEGRPAAAARPPQKAGEA